MKKISLAVSLLFCSMLLHAQGTDTTSNSYQLGKKVGSFIPVILLMALAIFTILYFIRKSRKS